MRILKRVCMEKLKGQEHNFTAKLRQESVVKTLKKYIVWQRKSRFDSPPPPATGPVSINLDLTSTCNFTCPFCVDSSIINTGRHLKLEDIKKTIGFLRIKGLRSVILLGGGEPTLHRDFTEVVRYIKDKGLEIGIVTNGTRLDKIIEVAHLFKTKDWVRISIDAATEKIFKELHHPRTRATLKQVLDTARKLKDKNPSISLGYSFVIVWDGVIINGKKLSSNINEMSRASTFACNNGFDYISFKPCLVRLPDSQKESLLHKVDKTSEQKIISKISGNLKQAKTIAAGRIKILESINLKAMLEGKTDNIKRQPSQCHLQFFRTVVSPAGIFHCPAFRGVAKAKISNNGGYTNAKNFVRTMKSLSDSIRSFNARKECAVVGCFYHKVNWWIDNLVNSDQDIDKITVVKDDNFFL